MSIESQPLRCGAKLCALFLFFLSGCLDPSRFETPDQGGGGTSTDQNVTRVDQSTIPIPARDQGVSLDDQMLSDRGASDLGLSDGGGFDEGLGDQTLSDAQPLDQESAEMSSVDQAAPLQLCRFRFIFGLPDETPLGESLYVTGDFWSSLDPAASDWTAAPEAGELTREDQRATLEIDLPAFREIQYKVTRGDWERAEVSAACEGGSATNRRLQVFCVEDEVTEIVSQVEAWSDSCGE